MEEVPEEEEDKAAEAEAEEEEKPVEEEKVEEGMPLAPCGIDEALAQMGLEGADLSASMVAEIEQVINENAEHAQQQAAEQAKAAEEAAAAEEARLAEEAAAAAAAAAAEAEAKAAAEAEAKAADEEVDEELEKLKAKWREMEEEAKLLRELQEAEEKAAAEATEEDAVVTLPVDSEDSDDSTEYPAVGAPPAAEADQQSIYSRWLVDGELMAEAQASPASTAPEHAAAAMGLEDMSESLMQDIQAAMDQSPAAAAAAPQWDAAWDSLQNDLQEMGFSEEAAHATLMETQGDFKEAVRMLVRQERTQRDA